MNCAASHDSLYLGPARIGKTIADILLQTRVEEEEFLGDDRQAASQVVPRDLRQRDAIEPDAPARGVVEAGGQREQRRFARPAGTNQRGKLAERSSEGHVVQYLFITCLCRDT